MDPLSPPEEHLPDRVAAEGRPLLELLARGATVAAVARAQKISKRAAENLIADELANLEAPTRFAAGVRAVRLGHIDATTALASLRAARECIDADWASPTPRQRAIVRLLAQGISISETAGSVGVSTRTLRRQTHAIARANGLGQLGAFATGVLCEALGWT